MIFYIFFCILMFWKQLYPKEKKSSWRKSFWKRRMWYLLLNFEIASWNSVCTQQNKFAPDQFFSPRKLKRTFFKPHLAKVEEVLKEEHENLTSKTHKLSSNEIFLLGEVETKFKEIYRNQMSSKREKKFKKISSVEKAKN